MVSATSSTFCSDKLVFRQSVRIGTSPQGFKIAFQVGKEFHLFPFTIHICLALGGMWTQGLIRYLYVSVGSYAFEFVKIGVKGDSEQYSEAGSMPVRHRVRSLGAGLSSEAGGEGQIQKDANAL